MRKDILHEVKQDIQVNFQYSVLFTQSVFSTTNTILADVLKVQTNLSPKVLSVIDDNVNRSHTDLITQLKSYALAHVLQL